MENFYPVENKQTIIEKMTESKLVLRCDKHNKILPKYPFFGDCSRPFFASICCHVYFVADAVDFVVDDKAEDEDGSCHCKFVKKNFLVYSSNKIRHTPYS